MYGEESSQLLVVRKNKKLSQYTIINPSEKLHTEYTVLLPFLKAHKKKLLSRELYSFYHRPDVFDLLKMGFFAKALMLILRRQQSLFVDAALFD
jgi:hypothetical protein